MLSNMMMALVEHGRIETTERKARDLRSAAEKMITRATSLGDLLLKDWEGLEAEDRAQVVHAIRMVRRKLRDRQAVMHLFQEVAPRYLGRQGGYTRIVKTGFRRGDGAPMAILELVEAEMPAREEASGGGGERRGPLGWFRRKKGD